MSAQKIILGILAFVVLSIWLVTLPLTILGCLLLSPSIILFTSVSLVLTLYLQTTYLDVLYEGRWVHRCVSAIPFRSWFRNFVVQDARQQKTTPVLYSIFPHGKFCFGPMLGIHFDTKENTKFAVAPILFYIPIFGLILYYVHCIPASRHHIRQALRGGWSVILSTEGIPGIICSEKKRTVYYTKRWGAFRIARDTPTPMVVVWTEGEYDTYDRRSYPLWSLRVWLAHSMQLLVTFPFLWGERVFGVPTFLPKSSCTLVVKISEEIDIERVKKGKERVKNVLLNMVDLSEPISII